MIITKHGIVVNNLLIYYRFWLNVIIRCKVKKKIQQQKKEYINEQEYVEKIMISKIKIHNQTKNNNNNNI